MQRIEVEVLVAPSCTSRREVADAVRRAAADAGVHVTLTERVVTTDDDARALRMPGSPTVRIAGRDLEPGADARDDFGLG